MEAIFIPPPPGYRLLYLEKNSAQFGALNTGANWSQGWGFTFNKSISWTSVIPISIAQGNDGVLTNVSPQSGTTGKVQAYNIRNATVAAQLIRVYFLVKTDDLDLTVSWS